LPWNPEASKETAFGGLVVNETVKIALQNLDLPQYSGIKAVFGKVLLQRSRQTQPDCALFERLAQKARILEHLNEDCAIYVREIGEADAQKKCFTDVRSTLKRPAQEFDASCGDFWSEMAAIRVLHETGFTKFRAIHRPEDDGTTSDYEAFLGEDGAYVEVKNMRANDTILEFFHKGIRRLQEQEPDEYGFNLSINFPYDNPPSADQERAIKQYLQNLRGRRPPFTDELDLFEAVAHINVTAGEGTAHMFRYMPGPEPLKKEWFLGKIRAKADEAFAQMKNEQRLKVLVINVDSPSGSISQRFIRDAEKEILEVFAGKVRPYVLLYRHLVQSHTAMPAHSNTDS
jgi:hypothetical protein